MKDRKNFVVILSIIAFVGSIFFIPREVKAESDTSNKTVTWLSSGKNVAAVNRLPVPSSVKAVSSSYKSVNTSWGAVAGAKGYEVYRATSSTGSYTLISRTTATSYNNTGLTTNRTYYYKVRAYTTIGTVKVYSGFSSVVNSKPIPTAPSSVKAVSSYKSINTSWGAVSGANGYEVYRATSSAGTYTLISRTTATSYNNTGLATNSTYYYKVRAYTTVGSVKVYSGFSSVVSSKPIPTAPTSVNAASGSSSLYKSINVRWNEVTGASGYEVYRATSSTGPYTYMMGTDSGREILYHDSHITTSSIYYYKVRAFIMVGNVIVYSDFSPVVSSKAELIVPDLLEEVSSSDNNNAKANINWKASVGVSGYEVYKYSFSTKTYNLIATTTETSYEDTGLAIDSKYYYKVRSYKMVGNIKEYSDFSRDLMVLTPKHPNALFRKNSGPWMNVFANSSLTGSDSIDYPTSDIEIYIENSQVYITLYDVGFIIDGKRVYGVTSSFDLGVGIDVTVQSTGKIIYHKERTDS